MWICLSLSLAFLAAVNYSNHNANYSLISINVLHFRNLQLFIELIIFIWLIIGVQHEVFQGSSLCFVLYIFWIIVALFALIYFLAAPLHRHHPRAYWTTEGDQGYCIFVGIYFLCFLVKVYYN